MVKLPVRRVHAEKWLVEVGGVKTRFSVTQFIQVNKVQRT
jgi:hypothetical protein